MNKNSVGNNYERESSQETIDRRLMRKLGGLANRLVAGMQAAFEDVADSISSIGPSVFL